MEGRELKPSEGIQSPRVTEESLKKRKKNSRATSSGAVLLNSQERRVILKSRLRNSTGKEGRG